MQPQHPELENMVSQTEDDSRGDDIEFAIFDMDIDAKTSRYTREMNKPIQSTWFERVTDYLKYLEQIAYEDEQYAQDWHDEMYEQELREQELAEQYNQLAREWHEKGWM